MSTTKLANILSQDLGYCEPALKASFHKEAKAVLRKVAKAMGLSSSEYDLRSNMGGIAVSGEVTLHTDTMYVQVSQGFGGEDCQVLYRTCKGRKDYTGGSNNHTSAKSLLSDSFIARISKMAQMA